MTKEKKTISSKEEEKKDLEFNKDNQYTIEEAIAFTKKFAKAKFDESVEVHFRLGIDPRKGDQQVRSTVNLPHGTGKSVKIAAFVGDALEKEAKEAGADFVGGEDLINEIKKSGKTDFQVAIAEPDMMKLLAPIAKVLGPRGLMPSPKNDTITPNPKKIIEELKKGKVSFKNDDSANVHVLIGKVSFDEKKLIENYNTLMDAIKKNKPAKAKGSYIKNISVSTTMGPGIKVLVS